MCVCFVKNLKNDNIHLIGPKEINVLLYIKLKRDITRTAKGFMLFRN